LIPLRRAQFRTTKSQASAAFISIQAWDAQLLVQDICPDITAHCIQFVSVIQLTYLKFQYGDKTNYRCPYCAALLLRSEAKGINRYSKCCAKGKVKLHQRFQQLMRPFLPVNKRAVDAAMDAALQQADDETMVLDELLALLISDQHPESQNFMSEPTDTTPNLLLDPLQHTCNQFREDIKR
jgi:hypothetical protein